MNKAQRKQYCLQIMGITAWQLRQVTEEVSPVSTHRYLLLVGENLGREGQELINRMLQALAWPIAQTRIEKLENIEITTFFYQKIKEIQPEKILLYGNALGQKIIQTALNPHLLSVNDRQIPMGILPTIQELLKDVSAKKRAWQIMQKMR